MHNSMEAGEVAQVKAVRKSGEVPSRERNKGEDEIADKERVAMEK